MPSLLCIHCSAFFASYLLQCLCCGGFVAVHLLQCFSCKASVTLILLRCNCCSVFFCSDMIAEVSDNDDMYSSAFFDQCVWMKGQTRLFYELDEEWHLQWQGWLYEGLGPLWDLVWSGEVINNGFLHITVEHPGKRVWKLGQCEICVVDFLFLCWISCLDFPSRPILRSPPLSLLRSPLKIRRVW